MAIIKPFRALRPVPEKAEQVSCVPYDVVYTSEVREFIGDNPLSFLRVTRAEAEFPDESNVPHAEIFAQARRNLEEFIESGIFRLEEEPSIYIYRLAVGDHIQTGVVACCAIDEYENAVIRKHEKTRPDKVADRTEHMLSVRAQTGLIFLAFRNTDRIRDLIGEAVGGEPIYDFRCRDGVRQTVWRDTGTQKWTEAFGEVPSLYIADGHHRAESAAMARERLRETDPDHTGEENYNYVLTGMYPAEDLKILAYNRVVKDLNGLTREEFFEKVRESFVVSETDRKEPEHHGEFCMYLDGRWYKLIFNVEHFREPDPIERLDVSILQDHLLHPVLGIEDARTDRRIGFVGGARGTAELEKIVDEGTAELAFSLFPTTMRDLFDVSDMGEIMPPKSTWFEPKLKDGLLVYMIGEEGEQ